MKAKTILSIATVFCLLVFNGCKDAGLDLSGQVYSLEKVMSDDDYSSSPLLGTQWKLLGFVDEKAGKITVIEPDTDWGEEFERNKYTLVFEDMETLSAVSSTNVMKGEYEVNSDNRSLRVLKLGGTKINEFPNGLAYVESMKNASSYHITDKGLALYYADKKYMLFRPWE